jgi:hypothetical protein
LITRAGSNHKPSLKLPESDTRCDTPEAIKHISGGTQPRECSHQIRPSVERGHTSGVDQASPGGYKTGLDNSSVQFDQSPTQSAPGMDSAIDEIRLSEADQVAEYSGKPGIVRAG